MLLPRRPFTLALSSLLFVSSLVLAQRRQTNEEAAAVARNHLLENQGVKEESMEVVKVERVDWRDAGLGCPQKERAFAPVIISGHLVVIQADGKEFPVRVAGDRAVVCGAPGKEVGSWRQSKTARRMVRIARQALARDSNVDVRAIGVRDAKATTWSNSGLGCEEPGKRYAQVMIPGFIVHVVLEDKVYRYHTDEGTRAIPCPEAE